MLPTHPVAHQALKLALKSGQDFYDCLYLALAEAEQCTFATADRRFWNAMKTISHARHPHLISPDL